MLVKAPGSMLPKENETRKFPIGSIMYATQQPWIEAAHSNRFFDLLFNAPSHFAYTYEVIALASWLSVLFESSCYFMLFLECRFFSLLIVRPSGSRTGFAMYILQLRKGLKRDKQTIHEQSITEL